VPLGSRVPGRRRKVVTREPGDLPSAVVTREHVGRGVLTEPSQHVRSYGRVRLRSQVTCHNVAPEVSYHELHRRSGTSCRKTPPFSPHIDHPGFFRASLFLARAIAAERVAGPKFAGGCCIPPQQAVGYDFGFEQPIANDRFHLGVTRYHNNITNLINTNAAGTSYTNVGEAITSGYEAFASAAVTERLRLRTDYTYTKAIDAITELELLRRPRHKYTLAAEWNPTDQLLLSATWLRVSTWIDGNRDFSIQRLTAPGYAVLNLAANYTVNQYTTVFGRIDNLLNERYQNPTGFDRPSLGIFGGIRIVNR
jgi:TonB dependent receptor